MLRKIYDNYIAKYNKVIVISVFLLILVGILLFIYLNFFKIRNEINLLQSNQSLIKTTEEKEIMAETPKALFVDIKGAITNQGVYQVEEGTRISDVIKLAGGLTKDSDTSVLNLSKKINDEMVIIIYTKGEMKKFREGNVTIKEVTKYIEQDCKCPDPSINGACINKDEQQESDSSSLISINKATKEQLMTLTGIGESKAQSIIDYRTKNGAFKDLDSLKNVSGIGDSIFDKIKDSITL
ncbi:MAG: helix-hairpin-helix domain-containing protein [Bacilli bacterium]|nr:helix-hairpin-helix domain-containing protein [Bacilli bacterium]MDD3305317.1 helix-hairpin-helix domain-containing protein [Bacilli bacterium]MDD4053562.1 helix-hairpin-helix domain-containing protein [Bacilli bacterium]MDD4411471.1 helix-hairpin-helix domain-containing protein [Bacilli bacterium]